MGAKVYRVLSLTSEWYWELDVKLDREQGAGSRGGAVCPLLLLPASISVMQIEIFHFKPYNSFTSEVDSRACGA